MGFKCKSCGKLTRNKKIKLSNKPARCRGCGSISITSISDTYNTHFDFEELLYSDDEGYSVFESGTDLKTPICDEDDYGNNSNDSFQNDSCDSFSNDFDSSDSD